MYEECAHRGVADETFVGLAGSWVLGHGTPCAVLNATSIKDKYQSA